ncbi:hypothetical protein [Pontibacter burrus]|uniref:DUF937 domain-containing protein n=1 Tax=Pontibacter burrus TaxID=2704466 RepID=A0A6B3LLV3_9BACT|nr:hypothetical protein [Pontibacter burrus]NEM96933.1 hypothetical protein [Pontibacter burrus]
MLNDLINSVKGQLTGELQNKFQLQPDTANKSVDLAKDHLETGLKSEATSGNFGGILDVLKGNKGATEQPAVNNMIGKYVNDLSSKLGVPENVAKQVGPFVISFVMSKLSGKVSSEGDLMGMLGGNLKDKLPGGLGDKLGGMFK